MKIALPAGWTLEDDATCGVILTGFDERGHKGFVTVDERMRGFALGIGRVTRRGSYAGRSWKQALYADAVAALQVALGPVTSGTA